MKVVNKKIKIGILTILKVNNYGADLQVFALQKKIAELGYDAEIIDYLFYKHKDYIYTRQSRPFVKLGLKRKLKEFLNPRLEALKSLPQRKAKKKRETKFDAFHQNHIQLSTNTFHSIVELYGAKLDYDVFIVGSDQVWNPYSNTSLEPYFLTFATDNRRKLSYASSFGVSSIPQHARDKYCKCLNNLDYISVREQSGVELIKELTGRTANCVLDPTLLLDINDWKQVAAYPAFKKPYILLYVLTKSPYITRLAKEISSKLGWDVVRICKNAAKEDKDSSIYNIIDAGPSEFIGLFLNSSFVLTNSFHGTAFSVNFGKPFYTILPKHKLNNSRQQGLLALLKLEGRLIDEGDVFPNKELYFPEFTEASHLLAAQREQSINYLLKAVNGSSYA